MHPDEADRDAFGRSAARSPPVRAPRLVLAFCCLILALSSCGPVNVVAFTGTYGVNYGRVANNLPPPERVVALLKAAKIRNVRIYDANHTVLDAFSGSGLELVVNIPNELIKDISANASIATDWIAENVQPFLPKTKIRGIAVGNEVLMGTDQGTQAALVGAVKNVYSALQSFQLDKIIEVSSPHSEAVFANSFPPSSCIFRADLQDYMMPLLEFFSTIGSHFYVNAYPFLAYLSDPNNININYTLFQPNSGVYDSKTNVLYDNMFDAQIDAAYAALETAGYPHMEVWVSETGWASSGDTDEPGASTNNARTYNFNLRKRLFLRKGTPRRPNAVVRAYIFALFNENMKTGPTSERHYGLYNPNGRVAYDIGFPSLPSSSAFPVKKIKVGGLLLRYSVTLLLPIVFHWL